MDPAAITLIEVNNGSFETTDGIIKTNVAIKQIGNKILQIICDVIVVFPIFISITNPLLSNNLLLILPQLFPKMCHKKRTFPIQCWRRSFIF